MDVYLQWLYLTLFVFFVVLAGLFGEYCCDSVYRNRQGNFRSSADNGLAIGVLRPSAVMEVRRCVELVLVASNVLLCIMLWSHDELENTYLAISLSLTINILLLAWIRSLKLNFIAQWLAILQPQLVWLANTLDICVIGQSILILIITVRSRQFNVSGVSSSNVSFIFEILVRYNIFHSRCLLMDRHRASLSTRSSSQCGSEGGYRFSSHIISQSSSTSVC